MLHHAGTTHVTVLFWFARETGAGYELRAFTCPIATVGKREFQGNSSCRGALEPHGWRL